MTDSSTPTAPSTSSSPGTDQLVTTEYSESIPGLVHVRLNRPRKLNSLTIDLLQQLISTAHTLHRDRSVRVVILSGTDGNFSAGLDFADTLKSPPRMLSHFIPRPLRGTNTFQEAPWTWRRLPFPVIAAVEGYCFGGGVQIACGADFRFTSNDAHWSVLEAKWGLVPDMSGIMSLKQLLPIDEVKRLAMTGEITLRGKVLPVGGIKEKILAAKRAGISDVILCRENKKDIEEINEIYLKGLTFHYVNTIKDVIDFALLPDRVKDAIEL